MREILTPMSANELPGLMDGSLWKADYMESERRVGLLLPRDRLTWTIDLVGEDDAKIHVNAERFVPHYVGGLWRARTEHNLNIKQTAVDGTEETMYVHFVNRTLAGACITPVIPDRIEAEQTVVAKLATLTGLLQQPN